MFLSYLDQWYKRVQEREGAFTPDDRGKMFISQQTYKGMKVTVNALIGVVQFLLSEGCEFVLSERFCQDPLEDVLDTSEHGVGLVITQLCSHLVTMTSPLLHNIVSPLLSEKMYQADMKGRAQNGLQFLMSLFQKENEHNPKSHKTMYTW